MLTLFPSQTTPALNAMDLDRLATELRGQLLRPGDVAYDGARILLNQGRNESPALIVRCADADDVRRALDFAWQHRLTLAVRGGHGVADLASADGALVIDRSSLVDLAIDPVARIARVGVGVRPGDRDAATHDYGLICGHPLAVEIILTDGHTLRATAASHPDLFRAALSDDDVGVVTAIEYHLRPLT